MPLWGGRQFPTTGNTKPNFSFAPYFAVPQGANLTSGSLGNAYNVANVVGVTANGMANTLGVFSGRGGPAHAGWIAISVGRGFIRDAGSIIAPGNNITNGAQALINYGSSNGTGGALVVTSVNGNGAVGNVLSFAVTAPGSGINTANPALINVRFQNNATFGGNAYVNILLGGRAGRIMSETLVAMGSLVGSTDEANNWFVNNA
jgi:hypothetical protein